MASPGLHWRAAALFACTLLMCGAVAAAPCDKASHFVVPSVAECALECSSRGAVRGPGWSGEPATYQGSAGDMCCRCNFIRVAETYKVVLQLEGASFPVDIKQQNTVQNVLLKLVNEFWTWRGAQVGRVAQLLVVAHPLNWELCTDQPNASCVCWWGSGAACACVDTDGSMQCCLPAATICGQHGHGRAVRRGGGACTAWFLMPILACGFVRQPIPAAGSTWLLALPACPADDGEADTDPGRRRLQRRRRDLLQGPVDANQSDERWWPDALETPLPASTADGVLVYIDTAIKASEEDAAEASLREASSSGSLTAALQDAGECRRVQLCLAGRQTGRQAGRRVP